MQSLKIVVLGSGNVATHLGTALYQAGHQIVQVYSRTLANAKTLALSINAQACDNIQHVFRDANIYLVCLSDAQIDNVLSTLPFEPKLIAHTAGSMPLDILKQFSNCGVFYPLQTFSKQRIMDISQVPFCIEASNHWVEKELMQLAASISTDVRCLDSAQRKQCHVAAVLVNNFVNHLYSLGSEILEQKNIPFGILAPLINETADKIKVLHPDKAQTGPAARNDMNVIEAHKQFLKPMGMDELYKVLSDSIMKRKKD